MNTSVIFFAFFATLVAAAPRQPLFGAPPPDVDECAVMNGGCSHCCTNYDYLVSEVSYACSCPEGWEMTADSHTCMQIPACPTYGCSDFCAETPGSFECVPAPEPVCSCPPPCVDEELPAPAGGYELVGGTQCVDVDECSAAGWSGACRGTCENTPGCYECISADVETDYNMSLTLIMHDYLTSYMDRTIFQTLVAAELGIGSEYITIDTVQQVGADTEVGFTWFALDALKFVEIIQNSENVDWEGFLLEYMRQTLPSSGSD